MQLHGGSVPGPAVRRSVPEFNITGQMQRKVPEDRVPDQDVDETQSGGPGLQTGRFAGRPHKSQLVVVRAQHHGRLQL